MSVTSQVSNIVIEPVDLTWGNQHMVCVDTVAASGLAGDYFALSNLTTDYYVWFDDGVAADPAPAGKTSLAAVPITGSESAVAVAGLIATSVNATSATTKIHAKALSGEAKVLVEVKGLGAPLSAFSAGTSGMTLTVVKAGSSLALGYLDGNVEFGLAQQLFDIVAHQTGSEVLGKLVTGTEVGPLTVTLKETTAAKLKEFLAVPGQDYTPAGGTEVTAIGALSGSKQFTNVFSSSKMLIMHPTKNAVTNYDNDFAFWLAYPNLNNISISGSEDRKVEVEFSFFLDELRVNETSKMVYGDWTQNFLKA